MVYAERNIVNKHLHSNSLASHTDINSGEQFNMHSKKSV